MHYMRKFESLKILYVIDVFISRNDSDIIERIYHFYWNQFSRARRRVSTALERLANSLLIIAYGWCIRPNRSIQLVFRCDTQELTDTIGD